MPARVQYPRLHDDDWLADNAHRPIEDIMAELGCSKRSARRVVARFCGRRAHGPARHRMAWKAWENDILDMAKVLLPYRWLARRLQRTEDAVRLHYQRLGIASHGRGSGAKPHLAHATAASLWRAWQSIILDLLPKWRETLSNDEFEAVLALEWRPKLPSRTCRMCPWREWCAASALPVMCETMTVGDMLPTMRLSAGDGPCVTVELVEAVA